MSYRNCKQRFSKQCHMFTHVASSPGSLVMSKHCTVDRETLHRCKAHKICVWGGRAWHCMYTITGDVQWVFTSTGSLVQFLPPRNWRGWRGTGTLWIVLHSSQSSVGHREDPGLDWGWIYSTLCKCIQWNLSNMDPLEQEEVSWLLIEM